MDMTLFWSLFHLTFVLHLDQELRYLFLLLICTGEIFSTSKIAFLLQSKFGHEKNEQKSNSIQYPK